MEVASGLFSTDGVQVPLQSVHFDIMAVHTVVEYQMMQTYVNFGASSLQTKYLFPLLDTVGVTGFSATFANGETVQAVIKERHEATRIYNDAIRSGNQAALLEEHRPDIFQISVGNLEPGQTVVIDLRYCCEMAMEQDKFRLTFPSHVAPRYTPYGGSGLKDDSFPIGQTANQALFSADVCWETRDGSIDEIESPTHPTFVTQISKGLGRASVKLEGGILEADLILTMKPVNLFEPVVMWEESEVLGRTTQTLMLSFVPKFELPMIENPEVIFVVDCSGSMRGNRMAQAKAALQICLQSLPLGSRFNIVNFGSQFAAMSPFGNVAYNDETLRQGLQYVGSLDASMGGTELIKPLRFCLQHCSNSPAKQVILLTDGKVTNEQSVIDFVRGKGSRVFPLGIGSGVSTFLVNGLARATQGHCSFVQDGELLGPICASIFQKALTPAISDLKISWPSLVDDDFVVIENVANDLAHDRCVNEQSEVGDSDAKEALSMFNPGQKDANAYRPRANLVDANFGFEEIQQAPSRPPPVFASSHFCAFAMYPGSVDSKGEIEIMGKTVSGPIKLKVPIPCLPVKRTEPLLHRMAARALIRDIEEGDNVHFAVFREEAKRLSLGFSVLCRNTAFVAIDSNSYDRSAIPVAIREAPRLAPSPNNREVSSSKHHQLATHPRVFNLFSPPVCSLRPPTAVTNAVSWRSEGICYKRNEVFVDFIEKLSYSIGADGSVLRSVVNGSVRVKSLLSGMPELILGFNNKLFSKRCGVENLRFHQCAHFRGNDASISFLPPDGEFSLMSYEYSDFAKPPSRIETAVTRGLENTEYRISLKPVLQRASRILDFEARILFPFDVHEESPQINASVGFAKYCDKKHTLTWQAQLLETHCDISLTIVFPSPLQRQVGLHLGGESPTIELQYEIPQYSASGIQARFLKVLEKSGYDHTQHVRYHTIAEKCQHRLPF